VAEVQILHGKNRQILAGEIFVSWPQAILPWPTTPATSDAAAVVNESVETPPVAESPGQRRVRGPGAPRMPQKGIKRWLLYFWFDYDNYDFMVVECIRYDIYNIYIYIVLYSLVT